MHTRVIPTQSVVVNGVIVIVEHINSMIYNILFYTKG
jgi:hypothetical protein